MSAPGAHISIEVVNAHTGQLTVITAEAADFAQQVHVAVDIAAAHQVLLLGVPAEVNGDAEKAEGDADLNWTPFNYVTAAEYCNKSAGSTRHPVVICFDKSRFGERRLSIPRLQPDVLHLPEPAKSDPHEATETLLDSNNPYGLGLPSYAVEAVQRLRPSRLRLYNNWNVACVIAEAARERLQSIRIAADQLCHQRLAMMAASRQTRTRCSELLREADDLLDLGRSLTQKHDKLIAGAGQHLERLRSVRLHPAHRARLGHESVYELMPVDRLQQWFRQCEEGAPAVAREQRLLGELSQSLQGLLTMLDKSDALDRHPPSAVDRYVAIAIDHGGSQQRRCQAAHETYEFACQALRNMATGSYNSLSSAAWQDAVRQVELRAATANEDLAEMRKVDDAMRSLQNDVRDVLLSSTRLVNEYIATVVTVQQAAHPLSDQISRLRDTLEAQDAAVMEVYHLKLLPQSYDVLLSEIARRGVFKEMYLQAIKDVEGFLHELWERESKIRSQFRSRHAPHLPSTLLAGLEPEPPEVKVCAPVKATSKSAGGQELAGSAAFSPTFDFDIALPNIDAVDQSGAGDVAGPAFPAHSLSASYDSGSEPVSYFNELDSRNYSRKALEYENKCLRRELSSILAVAQIPHPIAARCLRVKVASEQVFLGKPPIIDLAGQPCGPPPVGPPKPLPAPSDSHLVHLAQVVKASNVILGDVDKHIAELEAASAMVEPGTIGADDAIAALRRPELEDLATFPVSKEPASDLVAGIQRLLHRQAFLRRCFLTLYRQVSEYPPNYMKRSLAFTNFVVGVNALFLPVGKTDINGLQVYLAFNEGCPHRYLSPTCVQAFRTKNRWPDYVLGTIVCIDEYVVPENAGPSTPSYQLSSGPSLTDSPTTGFSTPVKTDFPGASAPTVPSSKSPGLGPAHLPRSHSNVSMGSHQVKRRSLSTDGEERPLFITDPLAGDQGMLGRTKNPFQLPVGTRYFCISVVPLSPEATVTV